MELDAFTFISENKTLIFYNEKMQDNDILFNILHEFGHIFLEHTLQDGVLGHSSTPSTLVKQENEANTFACEVLAPSCILNQLNINSIDDILKFSNLPIKHSMYHINNITNFVNIDDISERLIKIFNEYITKNKHNNDELSVKPKKYKPLFFGVFSVLIVGIILLFMPLNYNKIYQNTSVDSNTVNTSTEPKQTNIDNNTIFYATKNGKKYHLKDCRYVKNKNNLIEIKSTDALLNDYEPCSVCIK